MHKKATLEILVGLFMLAGLIALIFLIFKVSGLTEVGQNGYYTVYASFDNTGDLKPRALVSVGGVKIGEVGAINLDPKTFRARATLYINKKYQIPSDSTASILTQGILGSNYVSLSPGFADDSLKTGSEIENTRSAIILENLIGQVMYSLTNKNNNSDNSGANQNTNNNAATTSDNSGATAQPQPAAAPNNTNVQNPSPSPGPIQSSSTPAPPALKPALKPNANHN